MAAITPELVVITVGIAVLGVALVFALVAFAPARAVLDIDTANSIASVRVRPLWGMAPEAVFARKPSPLRSAAAKVVQGVRDLPRMAHAALALPKLVAPIKQLLTDIAELNPSSKRIIISAPPIHPIATVALDVLNQLPQSVRGGVEVQTRDGFSVALAAHVEANAAPLTLWRIYHRFRGDAGLQEFLRRLRKEGRGGSVRLPR